MIDIVPSSAPPDRHTALSFVVVGDGGGPKAFIDAIRALALIKRFGDRMTLVGYGRHRRGLTKWTVALQLDGRVVFGEPVAPDRLPSNVYDVIISCSRERAGFALSAGGDQCVLVPRGDLMALAGAMMNPINGFETIRPATIGDVYGGELTPRNSAVPRPLQR